MRSFLCEPTLDSRLFESSSSLATLCASSLFHRRFCIPGSLDLSHNHVSNPGNHPTIDMNRRNNREGIPKDVKLANGNGQHDGNLKLRVSNVDGHTLHWCKTWSTGCPHRLGRQSRSRRLQHRSFRGISSRPARRLRAPSAEDSTYTSRVAFPNHMFTSITAEHPDSPRVMMSLHLSAI